MPIRGHCYTREEIAALRHALHLSARPAHAERDAKNRARDGRAPRKVPSFVQIQGKQRRTSFCGFALNLFGRFGD
jgi:hypothetical protein